ncbi:TVP38/TMEM64 family protein [Actinokineospora diospyrosa]|uniref:TVP38/TMEM64 family membrane protein n=1 Tax=Actinokineospora diospyrosa TaxID=103728 RepID=A0ABT1IKC9_9PSEU|nr:TVP38/TMEM64 family protein [Actinokineospora diospyrosa]MCP2273101.1 putative membrane protein YdjX, TVP38/TMEM64 family, SNARE-associated domain [Actinokineospora diospyrosa]
MPGRRALLILLAAVVVLVVIGSLIPIPSPVQVRTWAAGLGWATPVLFLVGYALFTVAPIPRTVFNLSAGLLLGGPAGVAVAMVATVIASGLAFWLARGLGRRWVERHLERGVVRAVNARLSGGGLGAIISLRLVPMIPFAPMNYCCGLATVETRPFLLGTFIGSLPGTAAAVFLGDALTGTTPPALLVAYGVLAVVGAIGFVLVMRRTKPLVDA